ncbi:alkaline phosphatase family protein [Luoshenia tenuis]|uniref:alkaline phosphatase family protein n=1 Tax=Luoshenia tenuis TaxID=2763654 RepID=UPI003D8B699C
MSKHLIVMSVDAMVFEDLSTLRTLPNFKRLIENGSRVERVRSIYPTLTHPIHVAIMTGCYAGKTGIPNNDRFIPGDLNSPWYNRLDEVQVPTLFHAAKAAGLTTAACRWPVTACGEDVIDYIVPEVMDLDLDENDLEGTYRKLGSGPIMEQIVKPNLWRLKGNAHPQSENFSIACAADIIRRYKPNLLMTHPCMVDSTRHGTGLFNEHVTHALALTDGWLGQLMDAVRAAGIEETTDFVVLSDHGHLEITRAVCPNVFLADEGLIRTDAAGNLMDWDAYVKSCALSAQVYLKDPADAALHDRVYALLTRMASEGIYGFSQVLTAQQADARYHLSGDFSFVLETDGFTSFSDDWRRPAVRPLDTSDYRYGHSTHGHMPEKGPQPPLLCMGPSFRQGVVLETVPIVDEGATFAKVLGLTLPLADGKPIDALLK